MIASDRQGEGRAIEADKNMAATALNTRLPRAEQAR